ncbi:peptide deformylase [soil metagenome]
MSLYPIRTFGDPVLNLVAAPVDDITSALERLVEDMLETMYDAPGLGLAAPQIGVSKQIFVADIGDGPFTVFNPVITELGEDEWPFEEGCLSVPGRYWSIDRPAYAAVGGIGLDGNPVEHAGDGLLGRVLQHEIDHLHGSLLLERLPRRTRKSALRDLRREALELDVGLV